MKEGFENMGSTPELSPVETLKRNVARRIGSGDYYLEEGETVDAVLARGALLQNVVDILPQISPAIVEEYRAVLEENGVTEEQTGKLSLVVVGGNVYEGKQLSTASDVDLIFTAERPFLPMRNRYLTLEERTSLPEPVRKWPQMQRAMIERMRDTIIPQISELVGTDVMNEGVVEIKSFGFQRNEDVTDGVVIYTEV